MTRFSSARSGALVAALLGATFAPEAGSRAQSPPAAVEQGAVAAPTNAPVIVGIDPGVARLVDPEAVYQAIANELRTQVFPAGMPHAGTSRGTLLIWATPQYEFDINWHDSLGNAVERHMTMPRDPRAIAEILGLLAANLVRDDAKDLVSLPEVVPVAPPAPPPPPSSPPPPPPAAPPPPMVASPTPSSSVPSGMTTGVSTLVDRARARPFSLGFSGQLSIGPDGNYPVVGSFGLFAAVTVARHLTVGITDLGFNGFDQGVGGDTRFALSGGPFVEGYLFPRPWLQPFAQVGVPLQARFGGGLSTTYGAQPYLAAGLRFWLGSRFTIGINSRLGVVAGDGYFSQQVVLPAEAVVWSGGLELGGHL